MPMHDLRVLLLLVEGLVLALGTGDGARPPRPGLINDAGEHFYIRLRVGGGLDLITSYEVLYHSFGKPLGSPSLEKSIRVEDLDARWEIGLLEDLSGDTVLRSLFATAAMGPELFTAFVRRGYTEHAVLFREDLWDVTHIQAHRSEALWESYSEGVTRYAFPLATEEVARPAFDLLLRSLARHGVRLSTEAGTSRLTYPPGAVSVQA